MRFEQLRYLVTALELGSFRKAARELGVTQPSITAQVHRLEEELGVILVEREIKGIRPTFAAVQLLPHAIAALEAENELRRGADALGHMEQGQIRVCAVGTASLTLLPSALKRLLAEYPSIQFEAVQGGSDVVRRGVLSGEFDLGILVRLGDEVHDTDDQLQYFDLRRGRLVLAIPEQHPLSDRESIAPEDLVGEHLVFFKRDSILRTAFERLVADLDVHIVYVTESTEGAIRMVRSGLGISLANSLSPDTASGDGVVLVPLQLDWAVTHMSAVVRKGHFRSPLVNEFLRILKGT